ncbi:hypothetical protein [uncultured Helicobacter sp.]
MQNEQRREFLKTSTKLVGDALALGAMGGLPLLIPAKHKQYRL